MTTLNFKNEILIMKATSPKNQADFLFLIINIQLIIKKGFANHTRPAPPVNIASHPTRKASIEVLQPLAVQKQILKSERAKIPIPRINTILFSLDFSSTNICSSFENGM